MKEIKAYIRPEISHRVIEQLKINGATNISIAKVKGIGLFEDPTSEKYDAEFIEKSSDIYKIELICFDEEEEKFTETIKREAYTGKPGDGAIFISEIQKEIKIKKDAEGIE
ncbi:MAG: P-II family nitrogen regulator [Bacteroidota bacterium]